MSDQNDHAKRGETKSPIEQPTVLSAESSGAESPGSCEPSKRSGQRRPRVGSGTTHESKAIVQPTIDGSNASLQSSGDAQEAKLPNKKLRKFGDYQILKIIARGGMGVVYKARQTKLNRIVALKMILSGQLASEQDVQRFYTEAEAAAGLDHVGIVPIYEVGEFDGQHFFSMGYVDGESLAERLLEGSLSGHEAARLTKQISEAIAYAHEHGVIHRDLKPANVLIGSDGIPKVTDFGLAKQVESNSELTATGQVLGTPGFMPPEQAAGDTDQIGPAADIYSIGGILYNLLTERPPFIGASVLDTILQVREKDPVSPRLLNPSIDRDLETICLKCLQKAPDRRYETARELVDELDRYLNREPITARPIGRAERGIRWCKRRPLVAATSAAAILCLIAGTVASSIFAYQANQNAQIASRRAVEAKASAAAAVAQSERADLNAARAAEREKQATELLVEVQLEKQRTQAELQKSQRLLNLNHIQAAHREWNASHAATAWQHLDACRGDEFGWEHRYLYNLFTRSHVTLAGHNDDVNAFDVSPDQTRVVSVSGGRWNGQPVNEVKLWDIASGQTLFTLRDHSAQVMDVAFSPDGKRLITASMDGTARLRNAETGETEWTFARPGGFYCAGFSHDGDRLVVGGLDYKAYVLDVASGEQLAELSGHSAYVQTAAFSPDDQRIVTGSDDRSIKIWNADDGEELQSIGGNTGGVYCVAFNSTGDRIASACWDSSISIWDAETGQRQRLLSGHSLAVYAVAFSPDDQRIVSGSYDQTVKIWDAATGEQLRSLEGHTGTVHDVAFYQNGQRIITSSGDRTLKIWDADNSDETLTLKSHRSAVLAVAFSPDGTQLVSGSQRLHLTDAMTGNKLFALEGSMSVSGLAFSPDGKRIAGSGWDGSLATWDTTNGKKVLATDAHQAALLSIAYSPDGRQIACGTGDSLIKVYDADLGESILDIPLPGDVKGVTFTPDGQRIIAGSTAGAIKVFSVDTGEQLLTIADHAEAVYSLAISDDGSRLVTGGPTQAVYVWDPLSGKEVTTLNGHVIQIYAVDISPDGSRVIVAGSDDSLELWDVRSGDVTLTLDGHQKPIVAVAFSPDGNRIASGSRDSTVKIWDASDGSLSPIFQDQTITSADSDAGLKWVAASEADCPPSVASPKHSLIIFENQRDEPVSLYWSDWDGVRVPWGELEPGQRFRQTTYATHCWGVTDAEGNDLGHFVAGDLPGLAYITATGGEVATPSVDSPIAIGNAELDALTHAIEADPASAEALEDRAYWYGSHGHWTKATEDLQQALQLDPKHLTAACYLAPLLMYAGDDEAYLAHCKMMLETWGDSPDPRICERTAKACLLHANVGDLTVTDRMTETAMSVGSDFPYLNYFLLLQGLNDYRNDRFTEALSACQESRQRSPAGNPYLLAPDHVIEALAHHRIGSAERAQNSLSLAKKVFANGFPSVKSGDMVAWPDWLVAQVLLKEAEAAISVKP